MVCELIFFLISAIDVYSYDVTRDDSRHDCAHSNDWHCTCTAFLRPYRSASTYITEFIRNAIILSLQLSMVWVVTANV